MKRARELALAWWEDAGQEGIKTKDFNSTAYIFQMTNRFREDYKRDASIVVQNNAVTTNNTVTVERDGCGCRAASLAVIPAGESPASVGVQSML